MTNQPSDKKGEEYPCHICAGTMIHGQTYTFPREYDPKKPSCGKVYTMIGMGASVVAGPSPASVLVTCWRCKGTGWVKERRSFRRRNQATRRFGDSALSSGAPPKGWRLVPEEPTAEMMRVGYERGAAGEYNEGIYKAMLAVAPLPSSTPSKDNAAASTGQPANGSASQGAADVKGAVPAAPLSAVGPTIAQKLLARGICMPPGIAVRLDSMSQMESKDHAVAADMRFLAALLYELWPPNAEPTGPSALSASTPAKDEIHG